VTATSSSPLGRYDRDHDAERVVDVRLLRLPLLVLAASREHHDGLMREFRLMALAQQVPAQAAPARLLELVQVLGVQYAGAVARPDAEIDAALDRGEDCMDMTYPVPMSAAGAAQALGRLMAEADDYCRSEQLLTLARPPLVKEFADWYLGQFVTQTAGADPVAWDGPLTAD
jgi:hypothetical protein